MKRFRRFRATPRALLWLAAGAALLAACAGFVPQPGPGPEPAARYVALTTPIVVLGDTQEHEATGFPLHDNDSAIDAFVEVAQRPPEQPLFGRRILEHALRRHPGEPFLHLGDVLDMSCWSEADRMSRIFLSAGRGGAILPGNHDGLMFGIYGYNLFAAVLDRDGRKWNRACQRGADDDASAYKGRQQALTRRDFISLYLGHQTSGEHARSGLVAPPREGRHRLSWRNPNRQAFLSAVEVEVLDGWSYPDSFIAQRLRLPRAPGAPRGVVVIALDTNQAGPIASAWDTMMGRSPGNVGHVRIAQIRAVTQWVLDAALAGDIAVFAGHHDWRSLGAQSQAMLRNLMANVDHPLVYLSAHTHRGFWAMHRTPDERPLLEMNVSSLSDWPIAYRRISFDYDQQANRLLVRAELMPNADAPIRSDADLLAAWEAQACEGFGFSARAVRDVDRELVQRQRNSRGSILEWLFGFLTPDACENCQQPLYEHAHAYQDELLDAILQAGADLGPEAHRLHEVELPRDCGDRDFVGCARALQAERATDFAGQVKLFRRKAALVDRLGTHLDALDSAAARAYMTCRAVQAAKIDFDATGDDRNAARGEANRRAEQFFRIEASVGLE